METEQTSFRYSSRILLRTPMSMNSYADEVDYADNVSESEFAYDTRNFAKYGPNMNHATWGGLTVIDSLRKHKIFIYQHRDKYNKMAA